MEKLKRSDNSKITAYSVYAPLQASEAVQQKYSLEKSDLKKLRLKTEPASTKNLKKVSSRYKLTEMPNDYGTNMIGQNSVKYQSNPANILSKSMLNNYNTR
jgi:hypothetical protein